MSFLVLVIGQALVAAVIAATAWAAGSLVDGALRRTRRAGHALHAVAVPDQASMPWALTTALGFAAIGQVLTLAGLVGMLRKPVVLAITIGIHVAAIPAWRRAVAVAAAARRARRMPGVRASGVVVVIAIVAIALTAFLLTLYPPLGFDQTMYHLPQARAFAASGGLPFLPALRYPIFRVVLRSGGRDPHPVARPAACDGS